MNNLLKDLEAVALLADKATPGDWVWRRDAGKPMLINGVMFGGAGPDGQPNDAAFIIALVNLFRTHHAEIAEAVKDARRWRHARKILPVEYIEGSQREFESYGLPGSEEENIAADNAIDNAMHSSAREDGE